MIKKTHTRNQRRMYRIHKQEEQIEKDKIIIAEQQIELDKYKEVIDKIKEYMSLNMRVKLNEEFGETMQYKTIYSLLEEIE